MNIGAVWYQEKKVSAERVEGTSSYIFKEVQVVLLPGQFSFDDSRGGCRESTFVLWHFSFSTWGKHKFHSELGPVFHHRLPLVS